MFKSKDIVNLILDSYENTNNLMLWAMMFRNMYLDIGNEDFAVISSMILEKIVRIENDETE